MRSNYENLVFIIHVGMNRVRSQLQQLQQCTHIVRVNRLLVFCKWIIFCYIRVLDILIEMLPTLNPESRLKLYSLYGAINSHHFWRTIRQTMRYRVVISFEITQLVLFSKDKIACIIYQSCLWNLFIITQRSFV